MQDASLKGSRKSSLLLIATFLSSNGGSHSVMEDLAVRLRVEGYDLITASPYQSGLVRGAHMVAAAVTHAREYDAAIVDVYSGRAFMWGEGVGSALRVLGKPYILVLRGGNLPSFAARWPRRVRRLLKSAAAVTTPSDYLFEQMKPYRQDLILLPNPLDLNAYEFKSRANARSNMIWLRSFHDIYNPSLAPRVLALLKAEFPEARLTMIGRDKGDGSLQLTQETAVRLGVITSLHLPGPVSKTDVPGWLNQGDIFLNTTNIDNTPVSVLEAMACGLCVVSTNVGGIPYMLENESDALLVPPDNDEAIAAAVRRIITEPGLADRLSRNARRKAENFDWSVVFPQWQSLLANITEGRHAAVAKC